MTRSTCEERAPYLVSQSRPLRLLSKVHKEAFIDGQASIDIVDINLQIIQ